MQVLEAADQFLLPGLKAICGSFIAECLEADNVVQILRTARIFILHRLEDACCAFIAKHLEELVKSADLKAFITEDAREIKNRDVEKGDSIPIVDDIRSGWGGRERERKREGERDYVPDGDQVWNGWVSVSVHSLFSRESINRFVSVRRSVRMSQLGIGDYDSRLVACIRPCFLNRG